MSKSSERQASAGRTCLSRIWFALLIIAVKKIIQNLRKLLMTLTLRKIGATGLEPATFGPPVQRASQTALRPVLSDNCNRMMVLKQAKSAFRLDLNR